MISSVKFSGYAEIFFDLDGVILDTNSIKKHNIGMAVAFKEVSFREEFVSYFTSNNGIPRELKINNYFVGGEADKVLESYNRLNQDSLNEAKPVPGVVALLQDLFQQGIPLHVFTGGTEKESRNLLYGLGLASYFSGIHGGPRTKKENFDQQTHHHPILMFGDSLSDYEFAESRDLDFVFVHGYTQFSGWQEFFSSRSIIAAIPDFLAIKSIEAPPK
jgi:phosphoglycolate phosphatase-like HAD superfamily hydrolase